MAFNEIEVLKLVKDASETTEAWVINARTYSKTLRALINGEGFHDELIDNIEKISRKDRKKARRKYARDIRDLFARVFAKRQNVFDANGGSEVNLIKNDTIKKDFNNRLSNFKSNKSIDKYLSEQYFNLYDIDPNGVLLLEYKTNEKDFDAYPVYKSINDIRTYIPNGQKVEYIILEPKDYDNVNMRTWRVIDDKTDWTINEISNVFVINENKTFEHPFGEVPALILSEKEKIGTNERYSSVHKVLELSRDYAKDRSTLNIYKHQKGFPFHWRFGKKCPGCNSTGKINGETCETCKGASSPIRGDITDIYLMPVPKDGQPSLPNKLMGFESPDLETWLQLVKDIDNLDSLIEDTIWNTSNRKEVDKINKTATASFIDTQPIQTALHPYSNVVEYVHNTLAGWVLNLVDRAKDRIEIQYTKNYGRRYIIESPDALISKYQTSKEKGDNNVILDKILEEIILSTYKSDPVMQELALKKSQIEPYVHLSVNQVNDIFGAEQANKKVLFPKFWYDAKKDKSKEELIKEFNEYFKTNKNENSSSKTSPTIREGQQEQV